MRYLSATLISSLVLLSSVGARAQAPSMTAMSPAPHAASCDDFRHLGKGTWQPRVPVTVFNDAESRLLIPAARIEPEKIVAGLDLAQALSTQCRRS